MHNLFASPTDRLSANRYGCKGANKLLTKRARSTAQSVLVDGQLSSRSERGGSHSLGDDLVEEEFRIFEIGLAVLIRHRRVDDFAI